MKRKLTVTTRIVSFVMAVLLMVTNNVTPVAYAYNNVVTEHDEYDDVVIIEDDDTVPTSMLSLGQKENILKPSVETTNNWENSADTAETSLDEFVDWNFENRLLVTKETDGWKASIDYTDTTDGYVIVQCTSNEEKRLKATVVEENEDKMYKYDLTSSQWTILPFSKGSGNYKITIYQNISGNKYRPLLYEVVNVDLSNELNPFLVANQYVNFTSDSKVVQKASELVQGAQNDAEKVAAIYDYIVSNMTYDYNKAETISSPYLPNLEEILESKKGICLDYAALIVGMLRSQNIPAKIVIGYSGEVYHAWISVYLEDEVTSLCGMTYYDEEHWLHMDPTFDSGNNGSRSILRYINNSDNYAGEYYY